MFFLNINVKNIGIPYGEMLIYIPPVGMDVIEGGRQKQVFKVDTEGDCFRIETKINGQSGKLLLNLKKVFGFLRLLDQQSAVYIENQSVENSSSDITQLMESLLPFLQIFLDVIARLIEKNNDQKSLAETKLLPAIKK